MTELNLHFVQQLRGLWWLKITIRTPKSNHTESFHGEEDIACVASIIKKYYKSIKMLKNVIKRLPWMFCDFFFFFSVLMERIILTGSAYEWQAGAKSGTCNSDAKGRAKLNGVIKIWEWQ